MPPDSQNEAQRRKMARVMVLSAVVTVIVGILLGALVWAPLYALTALGVIDLMLARAYKTGRLPAGNATEAAAADPSYNPYARED